MRRTEGFSLIELMIVVVIIMITATLALPAIASGMRDRIANEGALDLVRVARRARAEAAGYGRAHLLRFAAANDGSADLYRGTVGRCALNDWNTITAGGCANNTMCTDSIVMQRRNSMGATVRMTLDSGAQTMDICFEPSGLVRYRTAPADAFSSNNAVNGGFRFVFQRYIAQGNFGAVRSALIPLGGSARILR